MDDTLAEAAGGLLESILLHFETLEQPETPIVGAAVTNTGTLPSNPWGIFDLILGFWLQSYAYLDGKARKGDCQAAMTAVAPSFIGEFGNYNGGVGTSFTKVLKLTVTQLMNWWAVLNTVVICVGQYNFSVQNPWLDVFKSKGTLHPYEMGVEARRRAAANGTLTNTYMQSASAHKKAYPAEKKVAAPDTD